jgi:DNA-binding MarR family transcriptional regulator
LHRLEAKGLVEGRMDPEDARAVQLLLAAGEGERAVRVRDLWIVNAADLRRCGLADSRRFDADGGGALCRIESGTLKRFPID